MAVVQNGYGDVEAKRHDTVKFEERVKEAFRKCEYRCTCGGIDYHMLDSREWSISRSEVWMTCNCCGRKNYFNRERLSKFVEERLG